MQDPLVSVPSNRVYGLKISKALQHKLQRKSQLVAAYLSDRVDK